MVRELFCIATVVAVAGSVMGQQLGEPQTEEERIVTKQLSADEKSFVVIEDMEAVLERQRAFEARGEVLRNKVGQNGRWVVPGARALFDAHSGQKYVINEWGDTRMGIGFPRDVDVHGAWFFPHGSGTDAIAARTIKAIGYRDGEPIKETAWHKVAGAGMSYFEMDLDGVDRIEIVATPSPQGGGWYGMDDFAFGPMGSELGDDLSTVLDFEDLPLKTKLGMVDYAGLTWETGTGDFNEGTPAIQAPGQREQDLFEEPLQEERNGAARGGGATQPQEVKNFQTIQLGDSGASFIPPDTCGAVGTNHYVVAVNSTLGIYNKVNGAELAVVTLASFLPGSSGDPRILFDQYENRWVIMATNFGNRNYVAVSETDNPLGNFFKFNYIASTGVDSNRWVDYPTLGLDQDGYYIASNMFNNSGGFGAVQIAAIEKAPLIAGSPSVGNITLFQNISAFTIQPCHHFGNTNNDNAYTVETVNSTNLRVRRISGDLSTSPTLTTVDTVGGVLSASTPPDAPSPGSTVNLDSGDTRCSQSVYRDGSLWTTRTANVNGRAAIRWYELDTSAGSSTIEQQGTIDSATLYYYYPSISVDGDQNVLVGFSASNASTRPQCRVVGRSGIDAQNVMSDPIVYRNSNNASYTVTDGFGRNRWGDYSATSWDPVDDSLWTIQEYIQGNNIWGTHVAQYAYQLSGPDSFNLITPADMATGVAENAFFQWGNAVGAQSYLLEVDDDPGFGSPEVSQSVVFTSFQLGFGVLDPGEQYYWRVSAINPFGTTVSTPSSRSFITDGPLPPSPLLATPTAGATVLTDEVLFQWTENADADTYTLEVDDDPGFGSPEILEANIPFAGMGLNSFTPAPGILLNGVTYNWRVTAFNLVGQVGSTPASQDFTVDLGPSSCDGDANGDGIVDVNDISFVLFRLGDTGALCIDGDANANGVVDVNDISYVLFRLGICDDPNPCDIVK